LRSCSPRRCRPRKWLRKLAEKLLTEEERSADRGAGRLGQADGDAAQRLAEQKERHEGGNKWIGTGGTSPFGAQWLQPRGRAHRAGLIRATAARSRCGSKREYRNFDDTVELGTRNIKLALRLRKFAREGAADELDLMGTIDATARNAGCSI
jgi:uncharacterized protein with von Willebrand factor type A (vWA) domain